MDGLLGQIHLALKNMKRQDIDIEKVSADEHNLRMLINNTDDPIWLVDTNFNIIECNNSFKRWVFHFIGKELRQGDNVLYNGVNKNYLDKFETCYQYALNGHAFKSVEDMLVDGRLRYTGVSFNPVFDQDNQVTGVSCFARDITEQRQHLLRIEEQNTALREIAFIESHKVRGPVSTIMGLVQVINDPNNTEEVNQEIIEAIITASYQLDTIIREVVRKSSEIGLQP